MEKIVSVIDVAVGSIILVAGYFYIPENDDQQHGSGAKFLVYFIQILLIISGFLLRMR